MVETVSITIDEYNEYIELKKEKNEAIAHVDSSLDALKQKKVVNL